MVRESGVRSNRKIRYMDEVERVCPEACKKHLKAPHLLGELPRHISKNVNGLQPSA